MPTWNPPESADSLPKNTMSKGPLAASSARMASSRAAAVASASHSDPSVCRWTARSTPRAIASRSCSTASGGPSVSTTESPLLTSTRRTASSTPHSSCGLIVKPRCWVLIARASSVSTIRPPVIGTRLTQTATRKSLSPNARVVWIEQRRCAGDRNRNRVALAHVLHQQPVAGHGLLRRQVGHQDVLAHRRPGAGARDVRAAPAAIDDPLAVWREDGLSPQHVALLTGLRSVVVHRQGAEDRQRILLAMPQVRGLAHEVLLLDPRRGHSRLDHVVLGLELVSVGSIGLLEPAGGAVDPDAASRHAVRAARLPQRVPQLQALLHGHIQLPAEVADVRDAGGEHALRADLDHPARAELEAFVRHVVGGGARQDVSRARAPQTDRCHR